MYHATMLHDIIVRYNLQPLIFVSISYVMFSSYPHDANCIVSFEFDMLQLVFYH